MEERERGINISFNIEAVGKNIKWKKEKWESISLPFNIEAVGKNIEWKKEKGESIFPLILRLWGRI